MLKQSNYNWLLEHDGEMIIFNGASGCLARIKPSLHQLTREIFSCTSTDNIINTIPDDYLSDLVNGGFLRDSSYNELEILRHTHLTSRYSIELSGVTVVPTTRCNFRCPYCIQDHHQSCDMHKEVIDKLIDLIDRSTSTFMSITFYGGEPLLVPETCYDIAARAAKVCDAGGKRLSMTLITNGYLLDETQASKLGSVGINQVQVTIDGNREYHNQRRILEDGSPTYNRIVDNVLQASQYLDILIRVNIDSSLHSDASSVCELKQVFYGRDRISLYIAPTIWDDDDSMTQSNLNTACNMFTDNYLYRERLSVKPNSCCAVALSAFILLPNGDYLLCWKEVNAEQRSYGSILTDDLPDFTKRARWMTWDPYQDDRCSNCRYLPTCGGGCPAEWLKTGSARCLFQNDRQYEQFIYSNYSQRTNTD